MNISRNVVLATLVSFVGFSYAGEGVKTETPKTEVTKEADKPAESKGIVAKAGSFAWSVICSPVTLTDWIASIGGAESFAKWLGSASKDKDNKELEKGAITSFFANNVNTFKRLFAVTETAVVVAAAYKAYQTFIAEEDTTDEEYVDVFGEEEMIEESN